MKTGRPQGSPNKKLSKQRAYQESIENTIKSIRLITGLYLNGMIPQDKLDEVKELLQSMDRVLSSPATQKELEVIRQYKETQDNETITKILKNYIR